MGQRSWDRQALVSTHGKQAGWEERSRGSRETPAGSTESGWGDSGPRLPLRFPLLAEFALPGPFQKLDD